MRRDAGLQRLFFSKDIPEVGKLDELETQNLVVYSSKLLPRRDFNLGHRRCLRQAVIPIH